MSKNHVVIVCGALVVGFMMLGNIAVAADPKGVFDAVESGNCSVRGWVYDPDSPSSNSAYEVWRDGGVSGGTKLGRFTTDVNRTDVNNAFGISGNHGFNLSLADSSYGLRNGSTHSLWIYAINLSGTGGSIVVDSSPKTIGCAMVATTTPSSSTSVPQVTFNTDKTSMTLGQSVTLSYTSTGSTSCSGSGAWSGSKNATSSWAYEGATPLSVGTYTYNLTCKNNTGETTKSVSVTVNQANSTSTTTPPPTTTTVNPPYTALNISNNASAEITQGQSVTLSWSSTNNATSCEASGAWSGNKTASSTWLNETVTPPSSGTFTYSLKCANSGGYGNTVNVTVKVNPTPTSTPIPSSGSQQTQTSAPYVALNIGNQSSVTVSVPSGGTSTTLSWSATNSPTSCEASGDWNGNKNASSSWINETVPIAQGGKMYTYSLRCKNNAGYGNTATVMVYALVSAEPNIPQITLSASPTSISLGESSTLSYKVVSSTPASCSGSEWWPGAKSATGGWAYEGIKPLSKGTYNYTLKCKNNSGESTKTVTVTVGTPSAVSTPTPSSTTQTQSYLPDGSTYVSNPDYLKYYSESELIRQSDGKIYLKPGVPVRWQTETIYKPYTVLKVSKNSITLGDSIVLSWYATNNATSCEAWGDWSGSKTASSSVTEQTITPTRASSHAYKLTCKNNAGQGTAPIEVIVYAAGTQPTTQTQTPQTTPSQPSTAPTQTTPQVQTTYPSQSLQGSTPFLQGSGQAVPPSSSQGINQSTPMISSLCAELTRELDEGNQNDEVRKLQEKLKNLGTDIYPEGLVTGYYGPLTTRAVGRAQLKYGVVSRVGDSGYGRVGPRTRVVLNGVCGGSNGTLEVQSQTQTYPELKVQSAAPSATIVVPPAPTPTQTSTSQNIFPLNVGDNILDVTLNPNSLGYANMTVISSSNQVVALFDIKNKTNLAPTLTTLTLRRSGNINTRVPVTQKPIVRALTPSGLSDIIGVGTDWSGTTAGATSVITFNPPYQMVAGQKLTIAVEVDTSKANSNDTFQVYLDDGTQSVYGNLLKY